LDTIEFLSKATVIIIVYNVSCNVYWIWCEFISGLCSMYNWGRSL